MSGSESRKILVIGAGRIGSALGSRWLERGHDVRWGVPDPADPKYQDLPRERLRPAGHRADAGIVVLATPFAAAAEAIAALGDLSGVTLIDCTNALVFGAGGPSLLYGHDTSSAEQLAALAPGAFVFKTLNQTGAENLGRAWAYEPRPVMFVAGDDAERKAIVLALVADIGLEPVDAGPLKVARLIEPLALLWIELAMSGGHGRDVAFALVRPRGQVGSR